jgi:hypothetical protein
MQPDLSTDQSVAALAPERETLLARVASLKIRDQSGYTEAAAWLKSIKGFLKAIEDARTRITKPINDSLREVNAQAKEAAAPFLESEQKIKRAMIVFSDEQDRIAREEQRRQNELAAKEQARLKEIADRAAAKGQTVKAEQFEERAQAVMSPIVQTAAPKVAGVSIPKVWTFEITDEDLIPREYLIVDESRIRRVVTALKGDTKIPGVRVFETKRISAGAT